MKKQAKDKAKNQLNKDYERTRKILREEIEVVMAQHHEIIDRFERKEKDLKKAYKTIE